MLRETDILIQQQSFTFAAPLPGLLSTGVIDQNAAHQLARYGEEMDPIVPPNRSSSNQTKVGFVNQSRALQRVILLLARKTIARDAAEFVVNHWNEFFAGRKVSIAPAKEQLGDLA
jgi:hypothetical protein